jgi:hypothetical protein
MDTVSLSVAPLLDGLATATAGPLINTRLAVRNPRYVVGVLSLMKQHGFQVRLFTPQEERGFEMGGPAGFCAWHMTNPETGEMTPLRILALAKGANSLDALRIAAHECAHVLTISEETMREQSKLGQQELMATDYYHWGEVVADSTAYLVGAQLCKSEFEPDLRNSVLQYLANWRTPREVLEKEAGLVCDTAATILNHVSAVCGMGVRYE